MSIALKQLLLIVVAFLFLLIQLGIRRASVKSRESPQKINGLEAITFDRILRDSDQERASYQQPFKSQKPIKIYDSSNNTFSKLPSKETENQQSIQQKSSKTVDTKSRLDFTLTQYINVCKTSTYHKSSRVAKYSSYAFGRLQWCSIPKSGTTFLTRDLRPTLRKTDNGENEKNGKETIKRFILVREPYSRLVSAFFSKIVGHPAWWFSFGTKIITTFRQNATSNSLRCGHDVTFNEFIKFYVYSIENSKYRNDHFLPIHMVCDLCEEPPDFIAKIETLESDMKFVLNSVNVSGDTGKSFIEVKHLAKLFMSFKAKFRECGSMCSLLNRFWWGQQATGLIANEIALPVSGQTCDQLTGDQLAVLAWDAHVASTKRIGDKQRQKLNTSITLWHQVSLEDRNKVRDIVSLDCRLFGYDCSPNFVFPN